jgi:ribosomal protein L27
MGRPLRKDVTGVDVIGTPAGAATGITVAFHDGSTVQTDGIILKQRGAKTFVVARVGAPTVRFTRVLVDGSPTAGQMRMRGSTTGLLDQDLVSIAKITKRVATDFSGNRYNWVLQSDSSADYIQLTAL